MTVPRRLAYLAATLAPAPGRQVADMDDAASDRAGALTGLGFHVAVVPVTDRLAARNWPLDKVDTVICVDPLTRGGEADHLRLLRDIHHHLVPGGMLIAGHPNPFRLLADLPAAGDAEYDLVGGRYGGNRRYTVPELTSLLAKAGFVVERVDTDFDRVAADRGEPPDPTARDVQLVARRVSLPPRGLAGMDDGEGGDDGGDGDKGGDGRDRMHVLDLGWAPDEADWLRPSPAALWRELITEQPDLGAEAARHYPLDDPYGGERAAAEVSAHFRTTVAPSSLTFGAGTTALLCSLSGLGEAGGVLVPSAVFPDLPAWALSLGCRVRVTPEPPDLLPSVIRSVAPSLVHMDRPALTGRLISAEEIEGICAAAAEVAAVVSVDEAYACYFGPAASAVPLVRRLDNLVVLRSLSKGYCWGGLRVGFAVASPTVAKRVREFVPPLQVSELAYRMAMRLLAAGDVFAPLRERTAAHKPVLTHLLRGLGLPVHEGHPLLPWVVIRDEGGSAGRTLAERGVRAKPFSSRLPADSRVALLRLSVPLSDQRLQSARELLR
jgi:histidinol-phosphate/aromatic aminotransferase/cobyric acid decarboxylase-like protein